ncbi:hypothetical protein E2C01_013752 [Portunus trituberculatus]|uniref:Uncharacterized protein n=1 Tax=Portunus trituberculatus TaxID=210409 RepID=A0A5B7DI71_PORTR|nr:hypothetical protein [Portunus trituberculatus]
MFGCTAGRGWPVLPLTHLNLHDEKLVGAAQGPVDSPPPAGLSLAPQLFNKCPFSLSHSLFALPLLACPAPLTASIFSLTCAADSAVPQWMRSY